MSAALADLGNEVVITAHDDHQTSMDEEDTLHPNVRIRQFPLSFDPWQHSNSYVRWLRENICSFDFVLIHSLFLSHAYFASRIAKKAGVPYAIRPHGSLTASDLARRRLRRKLAYIRIIDKTALRDAAFIFCTSEQEAVDCERLGLSNSRVIPLGVPEEYFAERFNPTMRNRRQMLYIGRLAPKKGLELIVRSLAEPPAVHEGIAAVIVGPDDYALKSNLLELAERIHVADRVSFRSFVSGEEKKQLLRDAGMFVLPSLDENFGVASAEALAFGLPQIVSRGVSHASLVEKVDAGRIVERDPTSIALAVTDIAKLENRAYEEMCRRARVSAFEHYRWSAAAKAFLSCVS